MCITKAFGIRPIESVWTTSGWLNGKLVCLSCGRSHGMARKRWSGHQGKSERRPLLLYTNKAKLSGLGPLSSLLQ